MNDNQRIPQGRRKSATPASCSALSVALLYPGKSLLQQASDYGGKHPACTFHPYSIETPAELAVVFRRTAVSVIDATSDPDRAVAALDVAAGAADRHCAVVYTETIHEGLELAVRSRGALLLAGPLDENDWAGYFAAASQSVGRKFRFGFLARQRAETDAASTVVWEPKEDAERPSHTKFRKIA